MRTTFPVAAPATAWAALADPGALAAALPGCRSVTAGPGGTLAVVTEVAVASVRGLWSGTVAPLDGDAVRITGAGAPGTVDLVVRAAPDRSALTVEGTVDGPLAAVGSALLAGAFRRLADDVLARLVPGSEPAVAAREEAGPGGGAPPAISPPTPARRVPRAAAAAGAAIVVAALVRRRRSAGRRGR